jgi:hypothetical protein
MLPLPPFRTRQRNGQPSFQQPPLEIGLGIRTVRRRRRQLSDRRDRMDITAVRRPAWETPAVTEAMNHLLESRTGCLLEALSHEPTHIRDSETDAVQIALRRDSGNFARKSRRAEHDAGRRVHRPKRVPRTAQSACTEITPERLPGNHSTPRSSRADTTITPRRRTSAMAAVNAARCVLFDVPRLRFTSRIPASAAHRSA